MNNSRVWLKRDKTCYMDLEREAIVCDGECIDIQHQLKEFLIYLCKNKEQKCKYYDIYANAIKPDDLNPMNGYKHRGKESITNAKKQLNAQVLKKYNIDLGDKYKDLEQKDIIIISDNETYTLYLGADYDQEEVRQQIADAYYRRKEHREVEVANNLDKINNRLIDVFCFPTFKYGEHLDLLENNIFICAPNGFGKSTLLKALLLATNPPKTINVNTDLKGKMIQLRNYYGIKEEYLSLFVNLKDVNTRNRFASVEDPFEWLLYASLLDNLNGFKVGLDEFKRLITYYNQRNRLVLIFDSVDEIIKEKDADISREEALEKIRFLVGAEGIASNAKVIIASRPLAFSEDDMPYKYFYMESLISNRERAEEIIEKYAPKYKDDLVQYIYEDLYLKYLVATPTMLIPLISYILLNWYNEEMGIYLRKGKYRIVQEVIQYNLRHHKSKTLAAYRGKNYEPIYEIFSYVSLFNNIENRRDDFDRFQNLILKNRLEQKKGKETISLQDIVDAYEQFSLFNTQGENLEFLAPGVLGPYYLSRYMSKFCVDSMKENMHDQTKLWEKFEEILKNKYKRDEYLYDMLVFFFGIVHEVFDPESLEYKAWIDYVVHKWNSMENNETSKKIFRERLKYLLEDNFVEDSCFESILVLDCDLSENEQKLKQILEEIK